MDNLETLIKHLIMPLLKLKSKIKASIIHLSIKEVSLPARDYLNYKYNNSFPRLSHIKIGHISMMPKLESLNINSTMAKVSAILLWNFLIEILRNNP